MKVYKKKMFLTNVSAKLAEAEEKVGKGKAIGLFFVLSHRTLNAERAVFSDTDLRFPHSI